MTYLLTDNSVMNNNELLKRRFPREPPGVRGNPDVTDVLGST